jgi:hypothetical protein
VDDDLYRYRFDCKGYAMNIKEAAWQHRTDIENLPSEDYQLSNVYGNTAYKRNSRINYTTIFCMILLAMYALCWIF